MKHLSIVSTLLALGSFGLFAQPYNLVYVSSTGADTAACGQRSAPCATFQHAASNTSTAGEVDALDAGDFGVIYLVHPITIDGKGLASISTGASCTGAVIAAVCIFDFDPGVIVLRNLSINLAASSNNYTGIEASGSSAVYIENVHINGAKDFCVYNVNTPTVIHNSNFSNCGVSGIYATGVSPLTIEDVVINNSLIGLNVAPGAGPWPAGSSVSVAIRNSNVSQNTTGISVISGGTPALLTVDSTMVYGNGTGISAITGGVLQMSNVTVTGNGTGLVANTSGSIISFVNNRIYNNTTNGAPTSSVYMK